MNSTEFQPLADYILIKPDAVETDEYTQGGIIIQHKKSITNRPTAGVILAKGKDCAEVEVGDYVVFPDTDGTRPAACRRLRAAPVCRGEPGSGQRGARDNQG